jgi:hypothetical protein
MRLEISQGTQSAELTRCHADRQTTAQMEVSALCDRVREQIIGGLLPPDEAYWWTRIAICEAVAVLGHESDVQAVASCNC